MHVLNINLLPLKEIEVQKIHALAIYHKEEFNITFSVISFENNTAIIRAQQLMNHRELYFKKPTLKAITIGLFAPCLPGVVIKPVVRLHGSLELEHERRRVSRRKKIIRIMTLSTK